MQALDLRCDPSVDSLASDPIGMLEHSSQIHSSNRSCSKSLEEAHITRDGAKSTACRDNGFSTVVVRRERPPRACTQRTVARLQAASDAEVAATDRKNRKSKRRESLAAKLLKEDFDVNEEFQEGGEEEDEEKEENGETGCTSSSMLPSKRSKIVTPLVGEPEASQLPRWRIRSMWQLASTLNFLNVFRPLLNIKAEFSAEELETALLTPNKTLADIHMPLLKAIPPVTRMALGHATWVTVLCRKLRDWWHWVAEGDLPIVASHGTEVELYNTLDPGVRVVILKALCDIRVEQEDIRNYIEYSIKHGAQLSAFRKERIGGDSHGISYWFEDDPIIGHRLYREIRKYDMKKGKGKSAPPIPSSSYQWEAVATNLDEFQNVSEKLFTSESRTEFSVGKKLKNDLLSEIEKVYKRKEKLLKKQHRQALMLDSMMNLDGLTAGRSLRDRKPVAYTFDAFDRTINEAIKTTKRRQPSPEAFDGKDPSVKLEPSTNCRWGGPVQEYPSASVSAASPRSLDGDEVYDDHKSDSLDRRNRQRRRVQRYSVKELVEDVSDNDVDFDGDEDIVGEAVYDDEYLQKRKQRRKMSSSSEGDEEYHLEEETHEEEEDEDDNLSTSEESDIPHRLRPSVGRMRRQKKLRSVGELQSGLRRSKRATRNRINYRQYEMSETDSESKPKKPSTENVHSNESDEAESSRGSEDSDEKMNSQKGDHFQPIEKHSEVADTRENDQQLNSTARDEVVDHDEVEAGEKRRFLDLNELAPGQGLGAGSRDGF